MTITKADLVRSIAKGTGLTQLEVSAVVNGMIESMSDELVRGNRIEIRGFGTLRVELRAPRDAVNPRTGERIRIPSRHAVVFRASEKLKARTNS